MTIEKSGKTFLSERVWPLVRIVLLQLFLMLGIVGQFAAWGAFILVVDKLGWLQIDYRGKTTNDISMDGWLLANGVVVLVNLLLLWLAWRFLERKRAKDMLWGFHAGWGRGLLWGLLAGLGEVLLVYVSMVVLGLVDVTWGWHPANTRVIGLAIGWAIFSSVAAPISEEVLYRGYWFQNVKRGWGIVAGTLVSAIVFGGIHLLNPDAKLLGGINIALSAVTWALGMLLTRSLWFPIGWHAAWNFCQFFVMGMPNSGFSVTDMETSGATLLVSQPTGATLLTGGGFGMEASLMYTFVLVVTTGLMLWLWRRQSSN